MGPAPGQARGRVRRGPLVLMSDGALYCEVVPHVGHSHLPANEDCTRSEWLSILLVAMVLEVQVAVES